MSLRSAMTSGCRSLCSASWTSDAEGRVATLAVSVASRRGHCLFPPRQLGPLGWSRQLARLQLAGGRVLAVAARVATLPSALRALGGTLGLGLGLDSQGATKCSQCRRKGRDSGLGCPDYPLLRPVAQTATSAQLQSTNSLATPAVPPRMPACDDARGVSSAEPRPPLADEEAQAAAAPAEHKVRPCTQEKADREQLSKQKVSK